MEVSICEKFGAVSPFSIRREKAREVFLLIRRLNSYNTQRKAKKSSRNSIRRPASDNWF